jgi:hypothetical protein
MIHVDWADRVEANLDLASLRSRRTPTVEKGRRALAYTTGLSQAEELWKAANAVSTLASPILRYYALMQASRAVAAASKLPNQSWEPGRSHGLVLELERPPEGQRLEFANVRLSPSGNGMAQTLAAALGSPMIASGTPLDALIASLWHQRYPPEPEPAEPLYPRRTLAVSVTYGFDHGITEAWVYGALTRADAQIGDPDVLAKFLAGYPGLASVKGFEARWRRDPESQLCLAFDRRSPMAGPAAWGEVVDAIDSSEPLGWQSSVLTLFLPALGVGGTTIHPLLCWYLVLYAFSMLARYHGDLWRHRLDIDLDVDAVGLIDLVDDLSVWSMGLVANTIRSYLRLSSKPAE